MKRLHITHGRTSLILDPATGELMLARDGAGMWIALSYDDLLEIGAASMAARRAMRARTK